MVEVYLKLAYSASVAMDPLWIMVTFHIGFEVSLAWLDSCL